MYINVVEGDDTKLENTFCLILYIFFDGLFCCVFLKQPGVYSLVRAQQSFRSLVQIHEKNGKRISLYH